MTNLRVLIGLAAAAVVMFILELREQQKKPPKYKPVLHKSHTIIPLSWDGDEQKWRSYIEDEINRMGIVLKTDQEYGREEIDFEGG